MTATATDEAFMALALALGKRGAGKTWPNPAVGCVMVKDGHVIGRGWTQPGGRPHAETEALARAGDAAKGATVYVTLEPCSNYGRTPPCCEALIHAQVARVVVGCIDPDPRVNGKGLIWLRGAGIEVTTGVLRERCLWAHRGLYCRVKSGRPMVTLKWAQSLDGRIALSDGTSKWLTGPVARRYAHKLRAEHDAILIGSGTALADDPELTCRIDGLEQASPVRVVLDRRARLHPESRLLQTAEDVPLWLYGGHDADHFRGPGIDCRPSPGDAASLLTDLADRGITRLLIEGGAAVTGSFLRAGLVDALEIFACPKLLGGDALPAIDRLDLKQLADLPVWHHIERRQLGDDHVDRFRRHEHP